MTTTITVKLQVEGLHHWPGCPIEEVKFLREPHRHIFHLTLEKKVTHDDRDIEIIQFKRNVEDWLFEKYYVPQIRSHNFLSMSCEMIAKVLVQQFDLVFCQVLEDNENGANIYNHEWRPE